MAKKVESNSLPHVKQVVVFRGTDGGPTETVKNKRALRKFIQEHATRDDPSCGALLDYVPPDSTHTRGMMARAVVVRREVHIEEIGTGQKYMINTFSGMMFMSPLKD